MRFIVDDGTNLLFSEDAGSAFIDACTEMEQRNASPSAVYLSPAEYDELYADSGADNSPLLHRSAAEALPRGEEQLFNGVRVIIDRG